MSVFSSIGSAFSDVGNIITGDVSAFGSAVERGAGSVVSTIESPFIAGYKAIETGVGGAENAIGSAGRAVLDTANNVLVGSPNSVGGVFNNIVTSSTTAGETLFTNVGQGVQSVAQSAGHAVESVGESLSLPLLLIGVVAAYFILTQDSGKKLLL